MRSSGKVPPSASHSQHHHSGDSFRGAPPTPSTPNPFAVNSTSTSSTSSRPRSGIPSAPTPADMSKTATASSSASSTTTRAGSPPLPPPQQPGAVDAAALASIAASAAQAAASAATAAASASAAAAAAASAVAQLLAPPRSPFASKVSKSTTSQISRLTHQLERERERARQVGSGNALQLTPGAVQPITQVDWGAITPAPGGGLGIFDASTIAATPNASPFATPYRELHTVDGPQKIRTSMDYVRLMRVALAGTEATTSGVLREDPEAPFELYYITPPTTKGASGTLTGPVTLPIRHDAATGLYLAAAPSQYAVPANSGGGLRVELDPANRFSKELAPPNMLLTSDPAARILPDIAAHLSLPLATLSARIIKLNTYVRGGHFAVHSDRRRGPGHIGTLVISLPSSFSGGHLVLHDLCSGRDVTHDWTPPTWKSDRERDLQWAYIPLGTQHTVSEVTQGFRITMQYAVYADGAPRPLADLLRGAHADAAFLPFGGVLLFALQGTYSVADLELQRTSGPGGASPLYGADAMLVRALAAAKVEYTTYYLDVAKQHIADYNDPDVWVVQPPQEHQGLRSAAGTSQSSTLASGAPSEAGEGDTTADVRGSSDTIVLVATMPAKIEAPSLFAGTPKRPFGQPSAFSLPQSSFTGLFGVPKQSQGQGLFD